MRFTRARRGRGVRGRLGRHGQQELLHAVHNAARPGYQQDPSKAHADDPTSRGTQAERHQDQHVDAASSRKSMLSAKSETDAIAPPQRTRCRNRPGSASRPRRHASQRVMGCQAVGPCRAPVHVDLNTNATGYLRRPDPPRQEPHCRDPVVFTPEQAVPAGAPSAGGFRSRAGPYFVQTALRPSRNAASSWGAGGRGRWRPLPRDCADLRSRSPCRVRARGSRRVFRPGAARPAEPPLGAHRRA